MNETETRADNIDPALAAVCWGFLETASAGNIPSLWAGWKAKDLGKRVRAKA